ncbi:MAG: hypothetical protein H0U52_11190 [Chloroflexi bacterium]|nr:hypothetical protein [Chloroflexota bacterium]
METWWFYEMPTAQAALEAWQAIDQTDPPDELTGLTFYSREGRDQLDHLYVVVCSKNPPHGHVHGVEEILGTFGHRVGLVQYEFDETAGLQIVASGSAEVILAGLLWQDPGEIELRWPEGSPRSYWAGGGRARSVQSARGD